MTFFKISLIILLVAGGLTYMQPQLVLSVLLKIVFQVNLFYFTHVSPPTIPGYIPEAAALDAIFLATPLTYIKETFPQSMRDQARGLSLFVPYTSETRVSIDRISTSNSKRGHVPALWVDVFGVHSPSSLPHILYVIII